ncbi:DUF2971 domain-containing protein [Elizabethkingia ursingii]|uniref:DUF2971 domain-containing protein n=1 Tax=Elizabethkingia ursingii TaxID=1756150 RepID=UPI002011BADD|nr:DUF2971 domain-containing protein [Elizabethkingia ursingii]MCL1665117.1 DUF2971 domain-containing protein [Elizabethkingia ursingii]
MTKDDLINFLLETEIPDNLENESAIVSEIFKYCWDLTPENLYRYRFCNTYSFEALEEDKFLLTKPTLFNDPYDSLLYIDRERILSKINGDLDFDVVKKLKKDKNYREEQEKILGKDFVDKFANLEPFGTKEEFDKHKKLSEIIHSKIIDSIINESLLSLKQSSLVACLSENFESILMWSHYADNHRGFVLNYDFKARYSIETNIPGVKATEFADKKLFPVSYDDNRFDATYYVEFHFIENIFKNLGLEFNRPFFDKLFYYKILLFKSQEWSYEREWRIIKQTNINSQDNKPNIDFITNIRPKEIILGAHIQDQNKQKLIEIANEKNIPIFQMKLEPFVKEYKLSKREL